MYVRWTKHHHLVGVSKKARYYLLEKIHPHFGSLPHHDERNHRVLQAYCTTNRSGEWLDFAANSFGVVLAFMAGNFVLRRIMKK